ncbi:MAG: adenylate kinase [Anaerolineales bacterium]|nr:adenylate kinase [Anaerolineales bacterium]
MDRFPYKRIVVIGTTSSGKSTLAGELARKFNLRFVELDALYWRPNWKPTPPLEFREKVLEAIEGGAWIVAGNYSSVRDLIWNKAECVIWLDYPFRIVFWRLIKRTIHRSVTQELLWGTNTESFWKHLKLWSEDSLIHWLFKTYWRRKRETPLLLRQYLHLKAFHFKHPKEAQAWVSDLVF